MDGKLLRGESFSGHEPNCAYLNPGTKTKAWASVGHVTGFDFPDDARAVAVTDWDLDGDVDTWIANRSAPQVRFLRNDTPRTGDWISLKLQAKRGQNQAIGARVTVWLEGEATAPITREVRAGEGFLAQSSKRLHFGLGPKAKIKSIQVDWRQGVRETFPAVAVGKHYLIKENGQAEEVTLRQEPCKNLATTAYQTPSQAFPASVRLAYPVPLPRIEWQPLLTETGEKSNLAGPHALPTLFLLWPSDAEPTSLQEMWKGMAALAVKTPEVKVLALADGSLAESSALAKKSIPQLHPGALDRTALGRLEVLTKASFEMHEPMNPPRGCLITPQGQLLAYYRTPPTAEQVKEDLAIWKQGTEALLASHLPYLGTWYKLPLAFQPIEIATYLMETEGNALAAAEYLKANAPDFRRSIRYPAACRDVAKAGVDAIYFLKEAVQRGLSDAETTHALAKAYLAISPATDDSKASALLYSLQAADKSANKDPAILTTLAAAQLLAGKPADAKTTSEAVRLLSSP